MSLVVNGVEIPTNIADALKINNTNITEVIFNGVSYWKQQLYSGPASPYNITANKTLVAGVDFPADIPITIKLLGGGGAGSGDNNSDTYGGYCGGITSFVKTYPAGTTITASIGAGGVGVTQTSGGGASGGATSIDGYAVAGGSGGRSGGNRGSGVARTTIWGTAYDGMGGAGGQSSGLSNGGNTGTKANNYKGFAGGIGSGGGGGVISALSGGGSGGRGQIQLSWAA